MGESIFDQIREWCEQVADRSRFVRIRPERIEPYVGTLLTKTPAPAELDPAHHHVGRGPDTVAFILMLDAVNFGSGYFPHLKKRPGMSGYFTVASSLNDYFLRNGPPPPERLATWSAADCCDIFGQERENETAFELMSLFAAALNDLGRLLEDRFEGQYARLVEEAEESAEGLVRILASMPYYRDVQRYGDLDVPFYKRGQLTAADLSLALHGRGLGRFRDLEQLTIFADNLVPHVLRLDGILKYDPGLLARIDREELIEAGSAEEIEIRACAVAAVERIRAEVARRGSDLTSMELDYRLWNRGQGASYKARPRHRCRCVFY